MSAILAAAMSATSAHVFPLLELVRDVMREKQTILNLTLCQLNTRYLCV